MFFIVGSRRSAKPFGQFPGPCRNCQRATTHSAVHLQRKLTLFFVPLVPLGSSFLILCNLCGLRTNAEGPLRAQLEEWQRSGTPPRPAQTVDAPPVTAPRTDGAAKS